MAEYQATCYVKCVYLLSADHEAVAALETHVRNIRKTAGEKPLFYGALFLWLLGHVDKAKDYIDKIRKISKSSKEVRTHA